jgi:hypothetical protein
MTIDEYFSLADLFKFPQLFQPLLCVLGFMEFTLLLTNLSMFLAIIIIKVVGLTSST